MTNAPALNEVETPLTAEVLEPDARPAPEREGEPLFRRLSKKDCLEYAAELAADMECGLYVPIGGDKAWPERTRFNISEILRRMGYGATWVANARRPAWWPEGGTQAFKGYVDWKVRERAMLGRITYDKLVPYVEAVTFKGFIEVARRMHLEPEKIPFRDLAQFTMRGVEIIKGQADLWQGGMSAGGSDAFKQMRAALDSVGDENAKAALAAMFDTMLVETRRRTLEVIQVPAKTA